MVLDGDDRFNLAVYGCHIVLDPSRQVLLVLIALQGLSYLGPTNSLEQRIQRIQRMIAKQYVQLLLLRYKVPRSFLNSQPIE
jgi:predicted RNA polymerase sigma factor